MLDHQSCEALKVQLLIVRVIAEIINIVFIAYDRVYNRVDISFDIRNLLRNVI